MTSEECSKAEAWKGLLPIQTIAAKLNRHPGTIRRLFSKINKQGSSKRKPGSGRHRTTSAREDRMIVRQAKRDRRGSASSIKASLGLSVTEKTVRNRLREAGMRSYWATKKPFISEENRKKRIAWAKEHLSWTKDQWNRVLWSDESPFTLRYQGKLRVWRMHNERYLPEATTATIKHDKKVNVWGCFSARGVGDLHAIDGIMEQRQYHNILVRHMVPSSKRLFPEGNWIFQHDNDPKHTAKLNKKYLQSKCISVLPWPAQSPDLNPIENLWSILGFRLRNRRVTTEESLIEILQDEWSKLSRGTLENLVDSMPRRCQAVIDSKGFATKY
jgi:transposase